MASVCIQAGCNVKIDGKCLEGLSVDSCPHFIRTVDDESTADSGDDRDAEKGSDIAPVSEQEVVNIYSGEEFGESGIGFITNQVDAETVIIVGDVNSGKTTLIGTLFDLFQVGPFKGFSFVSSYSLLGLERRCHLSRITSGRAAADTQRTKAGDVSFLHLSIKNREDERTKHFLLSDISGEIVRQARFSSSVLNSHLKSIRFCNNLIYLIDAEDLVNARRRATLYNFFAFITNLISNEFFTQRNELLVVISKWDLAVGIDDITDEIMKEFRSRFEKNNIDINVIKIASRPKVPNESVPIAYGLEQILNYLFRSLQTYKIELPSKVGRYFDQYSYSHD